MTFSENIFGTANKRAESSQITPHKLSDQNLADRSKQEQAEEQLCVGFDTVLEKLKQNPETLRNQIEKLKNLPDCNGILGKLTPYFTEEHWEIAATLEAYDKRTFDHSLRVATFVYDMTNNGGETEIYLRQCIHMEESSLGELFTAALFHDIGKTTIPCDILHDFHSRREWAKRANMWAEKNNHTPYFDSEKLEEFSEVELDHYFMRMYKDIGSDPLDIVPIEGIFDPESIGKLKHCGITPQSTFRKVLEYHERATKAILRRKKMYIASDIASRHHNYDGKPIRSERYPTEISSLRLGFELSLLRSMDIYDALTSIDRSYKKSYHPLLALEILIKETETEFIEPQLTKYVIRDLYKKIEASHHAIPNNDAESQAQKKILAFIT
ncbi:MAG: hypothetical protein COZ29_01080 [Candidatus Moranbacteria bacterium CG_4_10_14_3_um_filter_45_9]|nr:MAG: hypothetical protein AUK19_00425 [Candidatus Moranbacteria bacterium CG2_30_45_14]PIX90231.1 MAG: hypothetical protein COZ29_01080 [Candidatus Moranbacteria bacterium CG_4_10_14_3_um_filter_45_9]PJA84983.1 MAG: hypothetical protein CO143_03500 [Candidatus Moranbacteria bacterium CG_4_9_14_3_um_filter_45_14]